MVSLKTLSGATGPSGFRYMANTGITTIHTGPTDANTIQDITISIVVHPNSAYGNQSLNVYISDDNGTTNRVIYTNLTTSFQLLSEIIKLRVKGNGTPVLIRADASQYMAYSVCGKVQEVSNAN